MDKGKKVSNVTKIIGVLLIVVGISLIVYSSLFVNKKSDNNSGNNNGGNSGNNQQDDGKLEQIEIGYSEMDLLTYLPAIERNVNNLELYDVFQSKKVDVKDIDMNILLSTIIIYSEYKNYDGCSAEDKTINGDCEFTISLSDLKEVFGIIYDREFEELNNLKGSCALRCTLNGDHYSCLNTGEGLIYGDYEFYFINNLESGKIVINDKAEKNDKYVYIYQKYAKVKRTDNSGDDAKLEDFKFNIYKYSDSDTLLVNDALNGKDYYEEDENAKGFKDKIIEKYSSKFTTFKHTFKADSNGNLLYESTEEVK